MRCSERRLAVAVAFDAVADIDAVIAQIRAHGAEIIGEMNYEDTYRLAYIRGPEGIIVALAEQRS